MRNSVPFLWFLFIGVFDFGVSLTSLTCAQEAPKIAIIVYPGLPEEDDPETARDESQFYDRIEIVRNAGDRDGAFVEDVFYGRVEGVDSRGVETRTLSPTGISVRAAGRFTLLQGVFSLKETDLVFAYDHEKNAWADWGSVIQYRIKLSSNGQLSPDGLTNLGIIQTYENFIRQALEMKTGRRLGYEQLKQLSVAIKRNRNEFRFENLRVQGQDLAQDPMGKSPIKVMEELSFFPVSSERESIVKGYCPGEGLFIKALAGTTERVVLEPSGYNEGTMSYIQRSQNQTKMEILHIKEPTEFVSFSYIRYVVSIAED